MFTIYLSPDEDVEGADEYIATEARSEAETFILGWMLADGSSMEEAASAARSTLDEAVKRGDSLAVSEETGLRVLHKVTPGTS